jgi:uncharacterized coiled-coil DUF342 family protein
MSKPKVAILQAALDNSERDYAELETASNNLLKRTQNLITERDQLLSKTEQYGQRIQEQHAIIDEQAATLDKLLVDFNKMQREVIDYETAWQGAIEKIDKTNGALVEAMEVIHDYREIIKAANLTIEVNK